MTRAKVLVNRAKKIKNFVDDELLKAISPYRLYSTRNIGKRDPLAAKSSKTGKEESKSEVGEQGTLIKKAESDDELLKEYKITKGKTFISGFVQTALTFVPAVGWLALPFTLLAQVIGYTCYCEEKWQEHLKTSDNS